MAERRGRGGRIVQLRVVEKRNPEIPMIKKEQLQSLLKETGGHVVSTVPTKAGAKRRAQTRKLDEATFREEFAKDKELIDWVTHRPDKYDPDGPVSAAMTASEQVATARRSRVMSTTLTFPTVLLMAQVAGTSS